jgi:hypothetical protein
MSDWTSTKPTKPGWYLFYGHPDAEVKGILGDARMEFVGVTRVLQEEVLLFSGPGQFGPKAAVGLWMQVEHASLPKRTWPWENLEVVCLEKDELPWVSKSSGEKWYVIGEDGENILGLAIPARIFVPMWTNRTSLTEYITELIKVHELEEGCPPARIVQLIRPSDGSVGLAVGGRVQSQSADFEPLG